MSVLRDQQIILVIAVDRLHGAIGRPLILLTSSRGSRPWHHLRQPLGAFFRLSDHLLGHLLAIRKASCIDNLAYVVARIALAR